MSNISPSFIALSWKIEVFFFITIIALEIVKMIKIIDLRKTIFPSSSPTTSVRNVQDLFFKSIKGRKKKILYGFILVISLILILCIEFLGYPPSNISGFFFQGGTQTMKKKPFNLTYDKMFDQQKQYITNTQQKDSCYVYNHKDHDKNSQVYDRYGELIFPLFFTAWLIQVIGITFTIAFYGDTQYPPRSTSTTPSSPSSSLLIPNHRFFLYWVLTTFLISNVLVLIGGAIGFFMFFALTPYTLIRQFSCNDLTKYINLDVFRIEYTNHGKESVDIPVPIDHSKKISIPIKDKEKSNIPVPLHDSKKNKHQ